MVSVMISTKGIRTGRRETSNPGRCLSSLAEIAFRSSSLASSESRNSMGIFLFAQTENKYPAEIVKSPTTMPHIIINPMGIPISPIKKRGPGAGGTSELAIAAPDMMHKISNK